MLVDYWVRASHPSCCDVGVPVSYPDPQRKANSSPWGHLLAGGLAGATSRTVTAPLETLRIMAMTGALTPHLPPATTAGAGAGARRAGGLGAGQLLAAGMRITQQKARPYRYVPCGSTRCAGCAAVGVCGSFPL